MKGTKGFQLTGNFWLFVFLISLTIAPLSEENVMAELQCKVAYATYIGGSGGEQLREVIPLPDGSVLVGGQTNSTDLPTTEGVVQPNYAGDDPALGHPGIYGGDCFLFRLSPDGQKILGATYFGGSKQERNVYGMALDKQGNIVITSATRSPDLCPRRQVAFSLNTAADLPIGLRRNFLLTSKDFCGVLTLEVQVTIFRAAALLWMSKTMFTWWVKLHHLIFLRHQEPFIEIKLFLFLKEKVWREKEMRQS